MRRIGALLGLSGLALVGLTANAPDPEKLAPAINYALHCQGCHLRDGSGMPGKVPDMRGQLGLFVQVPEGRAFIGRVPGAATAHLTDAQLARVLNWLVVEMGPPPPGGFTPYSAEEVGRLRRDRLQTIKPTRDRVLSQIARLREAPTSR